MLLPHIVHQVSERWLILSKPSGWSLTPRSSNTCNSVISYLASTLGNDPKLFFPIDIDTRMNALAIVCLDKAMHVQFERFKARREIIFNYQIKLLDPNIVDIKKNETDLVVSGPYKSITGTFVNVESFGYLQANKLDELFHNNVAKDFISIYGLEFPDPFSPRDHNITIKLPGFDI